MSSTPEIHRTVKFSPYGKPINKSLLTPCRQMGLSRKRKTPSSLTKTPLNISISSLNESFTSPVTPVSHNESIKSETKECLGNQLNKKSKREIRENKDRTAKKCLNENFQNTLQEETEIVKKKEKTFNSCPLNVKGLMENTKNIQIVSNKDANKNNEQGAKKCLDDNFENMLQKKKEIDIQPEITFTNDALNYTTLTTINSLEDTKNMQVTSQRSKRMKCAASEKTLRNVKVSLEKLGDEDIESYNNYTKKTLNKNKHKSSSCSEEESEEIIKVKRRKPAVLSSDDEDCDGFPKKNMYSKNIPSHENEDMIIRENCSSQPNFEKNMINNAEHTPIDENKENLKSVSVPNEIQKENIECITSDTELLSGSSINSEKGNQENKNLMKKTIISDDEDFEDIANNKNKLTLARKVSVGNKQNSKGEKKKSKALKTTISSEKEFKVLKQTKSVTSVIDDDEDAFTSTPERDQNEKNSLIEQIKTLENEVKVKRKKVEDLKQAQIYKTKHNIEELKNLTDIWREGCVKGLHELLTKLQMHGPMKMSTLLHNLNISYEIAKTTLKLELSQGKKDENTLKNNSEDFQVSPD